MPAMPGSGMVAPGGGGGGSGDVVGPASATSGHIAVYGDTTGKLIGDGGPVPTGTGDVVAPGSATPGHLAVFGASPTVLADGGAVPAAGASLSAANTFTVGPQTVQTGVDTNAGVAITAHSLTQSEKLLALIDENATDIGGLGVVGSNLSMGNPTALAAFLHLFCGHGLSNDTEPPVIYGLVVYTKTVGSARYLVFRYAEGGFMGTKYYLYTDMIAGLGVFTSSTTPP